VAKTRRAVVITGVTRGLGRAPVDELAREDCTVVGCGRSERAVTELRALFPPPHRFELVFAADSSCAGG
jgi:NAD(P)-dependent dehydrogenase (short-subunit alcohol dehydrogenase family)